MCGVASSHLRGQELSYLFTEGEFQATEPTPEPGTLSLMVVGLGAVGGLAKRKQLLARNKSSRVAV